jgi:NADH-quinone oxidoreductase E subunit
MMETESSSMQDKATKKPVAFSPERMERFNALVAKYEVPSSALLPVLWLAQEEFGFLSPDVQRYVAQLLGMPPARVFEAVTFYVMFRKKDMGKWCLQVCNNITCTMMGSEDLLRVIKEELGISKPYEVAADGQFSVVPVQCLGSCDTAPVVQINDDYYEKLDPEKFRDVIRRLKKGEKVPSSHGEVVGHS